MQIVPCTSCNPGLKERPHNGGHHSYNGHMPDNDSSDLRLEALACRVRSRSVSASKVVNPKPLLRPDLCFCNDAMQAEYDPADDCNS